MDHAKYIVVKLRNREQAIRFPTSIQHKELADRLKLPVVSAGFCVEGAEWVGGQSESLNIASRPKEDQALLRELLESPLRETWDLVTILHDRQQQPVLEISFP